jgi:hypothetical protein
VSDLVDLEIRHHVAIISMRREAKRNAVDRQADSDCHGRVQHRS